MAKKSKENNKPIEFKFEGGNGNTFEGRIYESRETNKCTIYPLSLTINGLAIVGAKLFTSDKGAFVKMPEYRDKDGEYHSICYFFNKDDINDIKDLANYIESLVK